MSVAAAWGRDGKNDQLCGAQNRRRAARRSSRMADGFTVVAVGIEDAGVIMA